MRLFSEIYDYEYHIIPRDDLCKKEIWESVLKSHKNIRSVGSKGLSLKDPITGESFVLGETNKAEIQSGDATWEDGFVFSNRRIVICAKFEPGDELNEIWTTISWLAQKLDGRLLGERKEEYDIVTGKLIRNGLGNDISYGWAKENDL